MLAGYVDIGSEYGQIFYKEIISPSITQQSNSIVFSEDSNSSDDEGMTYMRETRRNNAIIFIIISTWKIKVY